MREPKITQVAPNEFRFEYEEHGTAPEKGDTFICIEKEYSVIYSKETFDNPTPAFFVIALLKKD